MKAAPKRTETPPAASIGHCRPRCARRRKGDDELRRTGEGGPHAEDDEHRRDALARGDAEGDGGDGADSGVGEQQPTSGPVLVPRVAEGGKDVDQRIEDKHDSRGDRQLGRHRACHRREDGGPDDCDESANEEHADLCAAAARGVR
jgi:hypothetical protein